MVQFFAYRRALRISALAVCSAAVLASVSPASARPHHGASRHSHHVGKYTHSTRHHVRHRARYARRSARVEQQAPSFGDSTNFNNANASMNQPSGGFGGSGIVDAARSFIGRGNPTARGRLWCAAFMNLVLKRTGHQGTGSRYGALVLELWPAHLRSAGRRHRRDVARSSRRSCRCRLGRRCQGQSDHRLRQSRQPRRRVGVFAWSRLRLRDADELSSSILRRRSYRRR